MIQLIAGCKAIHSEIFEDEDGVQDANSSFSLDQSLISSAHWKRKSLMNKRKQTARDLMEYTRSILGLNANVFFVAKKTFYKRRKYISAVGWWSYRDGRSGWDALLIEPLFDLGRRIFIVRSRFDRRSSLRLIWTVIINLMNGAD